MNRVQLIDHISENAELTKIAASRALDALLGGITLALQNEDPVILTNFGTFTVRKRAARLGRNPSTGDPIKINAAKVVGFKAGKALKEAVKGETVKEEEKV